MYKYIETIDLHGYTVSEAQVELEHFIIGCLKQRERKIKIIHGIGTGILREFVYEYLSSHSSVEDFSTAMPFNGGSGVTICTLK